MKPVIHVIPIPAVATETEACDYCGLPISGSSSVHSPVYCCYGCRFAAGISAHAEKTTQSLGPASALGFSIFFTMNVVMLTMALWSYATESNSAFEVALGAFLRFGAMAFSLPVLLLLGRPLVSHAFIGWQRGLFTTDLLLATGVIAAFAVSIVNTWRGVGHVYYEVGCVILVLVTIGRWLEAEGRSQASLALDQLEQLVPDTVRRWTNGREIRTPRLEIVVGDSVHVLAGERIPVDGRVLQGRGVVDEQVFTGESTPVEKQSGDLLLGGSLNLDGDLIIEVTELPTAGALGRLVAAVRAARSSKGHYQQLSDAWSQRLFPLISLIALGTLIFHGLRVNWDYGLLTALSVVLIACPCALALATPLAVWAALGTAAGKGVLFRSGAALEGLAGIQAIRWDKTGTLTTGHPSVLRLCCEDRLRQAAIEQVSAGMTSASDHVFSIAVREFLANRPSEALLWNLQTIPGRGLRGFAAGQQLIALGSAKWMEECGMAWGPNLSHVLTDPAHAACPVTAIGFDGQVQGLFLLEETLRPHVAETIEACRQFGLDQTVLTGDRTLRAAQLATTLGLPVLAELLPVEKFEAVRRAQQQFGSVAMVGDGLNDAPALVGADIGIAMGCGADVTRDSADLCLLSSDLLLIPWAYEFSRRTVGVIRTNLAWSFGYNSLGVILAVCGQLHPAVAAALMVLSSLMVLGNSLRLSSSGPFASLRGGEQNFRRLATTTMTESPSHQEAN